MAESSLLLLLLGVMAGCAIVITAALLMTVRDLRQVLRTLTALLPRADAALQESHRAARELRLLVGRANRMTHGVETVMQSVCEGALTALQQVRHLKEQARMLFRGSGHNGARSGSRRRHGV